jgi:hypothetical protein
MGMSIWVESNGEWLIWEKKSKAMGGTCYMIFNLFDSWLGLITVNGRIMIVRRKNKTLVIIISWLTHCFVLKEISNIFEQSEIRSNDEQIMPDTLLK